MSVERPERIEDCGDVSHWEPGIIRQGIMNRVFFALPEAEITFRADTEHLKYSQVLDFDFDFVFEYLCEAKILKRIGDRTYKKLAKGWGGENKDLAGGVGYGLRRKFDENEYEWAKGLDITQPEPLRAFLTRKLAQSERKTRFELHEPDLSENLDELVEQIAVFVQTNVRFPIEIGRHFTNTQHKFYQFISTFVARYIRVSGIQLHQHDYHLGIISKAWAGEIVEALSRHPKNYELLNAQFHAERESS